MEKEGASANRISEITKEEIIDLLMINRFEDFNNPSFRYFGRKSTTDFLNRLYPLKEMPSPDSRVNTAYEDIILHTEANADYEYSFVFDDERFGLNLENQDDEKWLKFLAEMFHPAVREKKSEWEWMLSEINKLLVADGYELYESDYISGRAVYSYRIL